MLGARGKNPNQPQLRLPNIPVEEGGVSLLEYHYKTQQKQNHISRSPVCFHTYKNKTQTTMSFIFNVPYMNFG